jgi:hypothetical protein
MPDTLILLSDPGRSAKFVVLSMKRAAPIRGQPTTLLIECRVVNGDKRFDDLEVVIAAAKAAAVPTLQAPTSTDTTPDVMSRIVRAPERLPAKGEIAWKDMTFWQKVGRVSLITLLGFMFCGDNDPHGHNH